MQRVEGVANIAECTVQLCEDDGVTRLNRLEQASTFRSVLEVDAAADACLDEDVLVWNIPALRGCAGLNLLSLRF